MRTAVDPPCTCVCVYTHLPVGETELISRYRQQQSVISGRQTYTNHSLLSLLEITYTNTDTEHTHIHTHTKHAGMNTYLNWGKEKCMDMVRFLSRSYFRSYFIFSIFSV